MTSTDALREAFADHTGTYLLSHSIGLPLRSAREAIDDYCDVWQHDTPNAWPNWLDTIDGFRDAVAGLIGGSAASVCPQSTVSSGLTKILDGLRHTFAAARPTILISEDAFPSLGFVCQHAGYDVRFIANEQDALDPGVWDQHLESDIDVAIITHVHSNTGELIPAADVIAAAHRRGVITVVDVAQSVGIVDIDTAGWQADFVVGSCVKWLSGGPGAGWLWAHPEMIDRCQPSDVGWFSHAEPFEFDIHDFRYAPDALRFWGGTPTVLPFAIARRSIEQIRAVGVEHIHSHNLGMTTLLVEQLGERVVSPHEVRHRSGTAIVRADVETVEALAAHGIHVDHRCGGIRVSPHVYTSEHAIGQLAELVASF